MKIKIIVIFAIIFFVAGYAHARRAGGPAGYVPQPKLLSPVSEEIDLTGKNTLSFEWGRHGGSAAQRWYYDFRLYKGRQAIADNLICKERVAPNIYKIEIPKDSFEEGGVYTWTLRQVHTKGLKSMESTYSFKVIRK